MDNVAWTAIWSSGMNTEYQYEQMCYQHQQKYTSSMAVHIKEFLSVLHQLQ
jgi:hypothetical protein